METGNQDRRKQMLDMLRDSGALPECVEPDKAITAVMCTLSERISRGEAEDVLKSVPKDLQELFQACVEHRDPNAHRFGPVDFFRRVARHLGITEDQAIQVSRVVFGLIQQWLPEKGIWDVSSQLPEELKQFWRGAAA